MITIEEAYQLVRNQNTDSAELIKVLHFPREVIRLKLAKHPNVTPEMLKQLAKDACLPIREEVAKNTKTPPEVILAMAEDEDDWQVLKSIASSLEKRPIEQACEIAAKANTALAWHLVQHKLPNKVLQAGLQGKSAEVFQQALAQSFDR